MNKGQYEKMRQELKSVHWDEILTEDVGVEETWEYIKNKIIEMKDRYIPSRHFPTGKSGVMPKKAAPRSVLDKIRAKRQTFKQYKKYRTQANYYVYAGARNQVKCATRKAVKEKEINIARNIKQNLKSFYT